MRFILALLLLLALPLDARAQTCFGAGEPEIAEALHAQWGETRVELVEAPEGLLALYRNPTTGTWTVFYFPISGGGRVGCAAGSGTRDDDPVSLRSPARPS